MFLEFFLHLVSLDFGWIIGLILGNLFFVFAFICLMYIFMDGKGYIYGFIILSLLAWAWTDFGNASGIALFVGGFLLIYYVSKIVLLQFAETSKTLASKMIIISEIQFIAVLAIYNFVLR